MPGHLFAREDLEQCDESEAIAKVGAQVLDAFLGLFEMLVGPSGKCVFLDPFPFRVGLEVAFGIGHGHFSVKGVVRGFTVVVLSLGTPSGQEAEGG